MSTLDRVLSGLKTVITATGDIERLQGEMKAIDARERDLARRVTFIEGVLATAGVAVRPPRLPRG